MEIRLATLDDIEALCLLLNEFYAFNAELQPAYCLAANEPGGYPRNVIESNHADFLIAIENGAVLGFVHIIQMETPPYDAIAPHKYAEIMAFMVTASRRKQGVGSMLFDAAKKWSNARNLDYIELFSLTNAREANSFYDNKDFVTVSHIRRYALG